MGFDRLEWVATNLYKVNLAALHSTICKVFDSVVVVYYDIVELNYTIKGDHYLIQISNNKWPHNVHYIVVAIPPHSGIVLHSSPITVNILDWML